MKRILWSTVTALLLAVPLAASAADGYTTGNVNLRAGPDAGYPAVDMLPVGTVIDIQGCTSGWEWCDVVGNGNRGWVAGNYIQYMYNNEPVLVPAYGAQIGIPIVTFSIGAYWGRYYSGRPFLSRSQPLVFATDAASPATAAATSTAGQSARTGNKTARLRRSASESRSG